MPKENGLTAKQENFCQEYLLDLNATQASIRAGYSADSAGTIGWENLKKPEIQARILELRTESAAKLNITKERILQEYARLAFFDVRKIHTTDGAMKPIHEIDDDSAAAIAGIKVYEEKTGFEDVEITGTIREVKLADKRAALDSLCKVLGYNEPDKMKLSGEILTPLSDSQVDKIIEALRK